MAFDPQLLIDGLIAAAAELVEFEDPLEAEIAGASLMSAEAVIGEGFQEALIDAFIPAFESRASSDALATLLAIGSVAEGPVGRAAAAAAGRLVQAGVPEPAWAAELRAPVTVGDCWRLTDSEGMASILACSFHRAGRSHAVVIGVDHQDCGAADEIHVFDVEQLPGALGVMQALGRDRGLEITTNSLDPSEFRRRVEEALDARGVHDDELSAEEMVDLSPDDDGPGYPVLAVLVRARIQSMPAGDETRAPHGYADGVEHSRLQMLAGTGSLLGPGRPTAMPDRGAAASLPAKRRKSGRPVPVYQIKVGLRGAKPPIWRRLEVPAGISLARLHTVIQVAFGWGNCHLHVFETPYGSFGTADADLGHQPDTRVTLEQVAPEVNSKLRYTYDFGDDWDHDIRVEKVLDQNGAASYPRCTGGRRAAPPDDCGGIWGYAELVEVLSDPADQEHKGMLDWLGLDNAAEFDPEAFDAAAVTRALSRVS